MLKIINEDKEILAYIEYLTLVELSNSYNLEYIFNEKVIVVA